MTDTQKRPLQIAVLLSGSGTSLENLFDRIADGRLPAAKIAVVISSKRDAGGLERARRHGVPEVTIARKDFPTGKAFNDALHAELAKHEIDLVALLGFLALFEPRARFAGRTLNVHPALIPAFCGKGYYGHHVHEAVLKQGAKLSGATVHFVDDEYDHGPIVLQKAVSVEDDDTPETLAARVQAVERELVPQAIRLFQEGRLQITDGRVQILKNSKATK